MTTDISLNINLMHLMCARICHDLSAPLSAVAMGLEMLTPDNHGDRVTRDLIAYSTQSTITKLEAFRCLTGFANIPTKPTGIDLERVLKDYWGDQKISVVWQMKEQEALQGIAARLLLAVLLTAAEGLFRGGILTVHPNLKITAKGPVATLPEEQVQALTGKGALNQATPRVIIAYFGGILAKNLGVKLRIEQKNESEFDIHIDS
jgi:histidine phosphotransferase ChpT